MTDALDFSADVGSPSEASGSTLERITVLSLQLIDAIKDVEKADQELKKAKELQRKLEETDLPELMRELGVTDIKLADGSAVKVVDEVQCAITEANRPKAHAWLENHGFGGLIKTNVIVAFARDEREEAKTCAAQIKELTGHDAEVAESVHAATLKSFIKEQLAAGNVALPEALFGIFPYVKAKITPPSAPKAKKTKQ